MSTRVKKMVLSAAMAGCATIAANASQGTDHGFFWSLFVQGGSASITFPQAGQFAGNYAISWNNVSDVIGGKGWNPGASRTVNYNCGSLNGGFNNFSVYGWTENPLIEYYICEMGSVSGTKVNTLSSD